MKRELFALKRKNKPDFFIESEVEKACKRKIKVKTERLQMMRALHLGRNTV